MDKPASRGQANSWMDPCSIARSRGIGIEVKVQVVPEALTTESCWSSQVINSDLSGFEEKD